MGEVARGIAKKGFLRDLDLGVVGVTGSVADLGVAELGAVVVRVAELGAVVVVVAGLGAVNIGVAMLNVSSGVAN